MSSIKLKHSGGNSVIIAAPSSNPASDRTLTLPSNADGTILTSQSSLDSTKLSPSITAGITMVDQWRVSSSFTSNNTDVDSNWERVDTGGFGQIGTGMTQSSGIFTFPSTGIYRIDFGAAAARGSADSIRYVNFYIKTTTDNSNYGESSYAVTNIHNANDVYASAFLCFIFDVTNVSTHKVKFFVQSENSLLWLGNSDQNQTYATFTRLGDT
jgi:hypothetical protein